jgi:hypothetical protein
MGNGRIATITILYIEGIWQIIKDRLPIVKCTGHAVTRPAKFKRGVPSDIWITVTSVSPSLSVDLMSIIRVLFSSISHSQCFPPPVA